MTDRIEKARQEKNRYKRRALEAEAATDRARNIAVALEQEVVEKDAQYDDLGWRLSCLLDHITGGLLSKPGYPVALMAIAAEEHYERTYATEAHAAQIVIEQVGLLQEWWAGSVLGVPQGMAEDLRRILDGATYEEVRGG
ncbi:hypothetical protein [Pseudactinotalea sp. Z1748]|uniref:hypothetical protein n=1 Tax=Pseudactinotalea sp. Z1748 TaxID=3413027 RepID=UPI003C7E4CF6